MNHRVVIIYKKNTLGTGDNLIVSTMAIEIVDTLSQNQLRNTQVDALNQRRNHSISCNRKISRKQ
ncbi:MAG: hypothetical protein ACLFPM_06455 [Candidatus Izemoplasmatales bacterium]